jgi:tetratricopeptide (TPR) repeat protein
MKASDEFLYQILNEAPSSETLFLLLANEKAEGRLDSVIRKCINALRRYPGDTRIRGLLAESCFENGWFSRAESEVETATAQIEKLIHLYKLKARVYSALNRKEEAFRSLEIYLAHNPEDQEALSLMQSIEPVHEAPAAPQSVIDRDSLQETPSFPVSEIATPTLAEVYFAQGQIQEAVATYQKVLDQNPGAEHSRRRLEEIKAMLPSAPQQEDRKEEDPIRSKKEKLIRVLETWRESIRVNSPATHHTGSPLRSDKQ